jgi:hypothetical protein
MLIIFKSSNLNLTSYITSAECALRNDMWVKFWSNDRDRSLTFWGSGVLHKSCDTQKSVDRKQTKKNIRDLYVDIKSPVDC